MRLFDRTNIPLLGKALDAYALRQKVTAANIANITTEGYRSERVSFEEHLAVAESASAIRGRVTHAKHLPVGAGSGPTGAEPTVHETREDKPVGYNELASGFNDVDVDVEMAELAKNQIRFKFGSRFLGEAFKGIQKAIRGSVS